MTTEEISNKYKVTLSTAKWWARKFRVPRIRGTLVDKNGFQKTCWIQNWSALEIARVDKYLQQKQKLTCR